MIGSQGFEGDLWLEDTPDGGDLRIEEGLFASDRAFNTAVYISLFGGNKEDTGKVQNNQEWWGNRIPEIGSAEKLSSRFQALITGLPMTVKNIREAENAAKLDLSWIIDEGMADTIKATGSTKSRNHFLLQISIQAAGKRMYDNTFSVFWEAGIYGSI